MLGVNLFDDIVIWLSEKYYERNSNGIIINTSSIYYNKSIKILCGKVSSNIIELSSIFDIMIKSNEQNLLVVSSYDKIQLEFVRDWRNFYFITDVLPFGNLSKCQIEDMFVKEEFDFLFENFSYKELEWAWDINNKQIKYKNIINNKESPMKHKFWFSFTKRQREIIAFLHQHIKNTQYKVIDKPKF